MTAPTSAPITMGDIRRTIGGVVRTVLDRDIDPSLDLFDQGATSLAFIKIVAAIDERYDITLDVTELEEASVDMLSVLVAEQLKGESL